jgi:hypothetical protein
MIMTQKQQLRLCKEVLQNQGLAEAPAMLALSQPMLAHKGSRLQEPVAATA